MKNRLGWLVALSALVMMTNASDIKVSWVSNGVLEATGLEPGTSYTIEWTSDLQSGFTNGIPDFEGLVADSNGAVEVAVPMFYLTSGPSSMFFRASETATNSTPTDLDVMVQIPAGTNSGTNPLGEGESYDSDDLNPFYPENYSLTVESFYMDATEVTKAQWDTVYTWAVANGYGFENAGSGKGPNHPVHSVSWYDCVKWCNARSQMEGRTACYTMSGSTYKTGLPSPYDFNPLECDTSVDGYRLPTSEEWEYAARGGLSSKRFPWGDTITHSEANYYSNGTEGPLSSSYDLNLTAGFHPAYEDDPLPYTSPVGAFAANGYGLYDMEGNVWEWCHTSHLFFTRSRRGGSSYGFARCGLQAWEDPFGEFDGGGFRSVRR